MIGASFRPAADRSRSGAGRAEKNGARITGRRLKVSSTGLFFGVESVAEFAREGGCKGFAVVQVQIRLHREPIPFPVDVDASGHLFVLRIEVPGVFVHEEIIVVMINLLGIDRLSDPIPMHADDEIGFDREVIICGEKMNCRS